MNQLHATTVGLALLLLAGCGSGMDEHAKAACAKVEHADEVQQRRDSSSLTALGDAAVAAIAAVSEAKKSGDADLRKAASASDAGSTLPPSDPLYRNPADVQFSAVADWCERQG